MTLGACGNLDGAYDDIAGTVAYDSTDNSLIYDDTTQTVSCDGLTDITYTGADDVTIYFGE